jgi:hypothetical protein
MMLWIELFLAGLMVIDVELDRNDHGLIHRNCD